MRQLRVGEDVLAADGSRLGTVERLVVDEGAHTVTDLVVRGRVIPLRELKGALAIMLIEHDMEAVFALADRVSVMLYGRVIATGAPAQIRDNAHVRAAYLGDEVAPPC